MSNLIKTAFLLSVILVSISCQNNTHTVISNKIQYDVNLKSPDPDYDWWIQNLPGPHREKLVSMVLEGAKSGKYQAYDYYNQPISVQEVNSIMSDTSILRLIEEEPPYDYKDTLIVHHILKEDILRLRFMEKWEVDESSLQVYKTVYGIAPIAKRVDQAGNIRWQPLFWIYTDKEFQMSNAN